LQWLIEIDTGTANNEFAAHEANEEVQNLVGGLSAMYETRILNITEALSATVGQ
jgi:hypothetical protein